MEKINTEPCFDDSNNRLTSLSSLLETVDSPDEHIIRAKALVDAIITLNCINFEVMEMVVKELDSTFILTPDLSDAHEIAHDILLDMPLPYRAEKPIETLSPIGNLPSWSIQHTSDEMIQDGLLEDLGDGRYRNTEAGKAYVDSLNNGAVLPNDDTQKIPELHTANGYPPKMSFDSELHGRVVAVRKYITRNNKQMAVITLNYQEDDSSKQMEVVVFPRTWAITKEHGATVRPTKPEPVVGDYMEVLGYEDKSPGYLQLICTFVTKWNIPDDACVKCSLFTATVGNLCSVCADFAEVDNDQLR